MAGKKKRPVKKPEQTEVTMTVGIDDRYYNVPTIERRSQVVLEPAEAISRAQREGLLGEGFGSLESAVSSAEERERQWQGGKALVNMNKAPQVTGGRIRRRGQLFGRTEPYNPGGAEPRGGGGQPDLERRRRRGKHRGATLY